MNVLYSLFCCTGIRVVQTICNKLTYIRNRTYKRFKSLSDVPVGLL